MIYFHFKFSYANLRVERTVGLWSAPGGT